MISSLTVYFSRQRQAHELIKFVQKSKANDVIVGGDFNVDPRDMEDTLYFVKNVLQNALSDSQFLDAQYATLGNIDNTYTKQDQKPVVYDYIWYKNNKDTSIKRVEVLNLKTSKEKKSFSNHQALSVKFDL